MNEYDSTALLKLCALIRGEEDAQQWLVDNGYRELSEFWDAVENLESLLSGCLKQSPGACRIGRCFPWKR